VSPHDPDSAVREIERLADAPGVVGIQIPMAEIGLGSSSMFKVYAAAVHYGLPIVLHPNSVDGSLQNSPSCAGRMTRSYAEHHVLLGQPGQGAAVQLVLSGALARFPELRVMFSEFGFSWVGPLMWRMDTAWQRGGGAEGLLPRPPSEYLLNQMRFTTQPFDEPDSPQHLKPLLDAMQAERTLVFSSDYPHWDTDHPNVVIRRLPLELRQRVAMQTARETFGKRLGL
jgi:predicted TIM-barrel fold metal-dependent hydrolase